MARSKKAAPEPPAIAPWMATFSDLMNLLLCFFVLLFSFSTVDAEIFDQIAQSFKTTVSVLPGGAMAIGEGTLVSNGVSNLEDFSNYFDVVGPSESEIEDGEIKDYAAKLEDARLEEAEKVAGDIEGELKESSIDSGIEVNYTSQYVELVLNGSLLFNSGTASIKSDSKYLLNKIGDILWKYKDCVVEIIGHTDNVIPTKNSRYDSNLQLSCERAISVAEYLNAEKGLPMSMMKTSGRGEYEPVASNDTSTGRAQNRRVEIKIHFNVE